MILISILRRKKKSPPLKLLMLSPTTSIKNGIGIYGVRVRQSCKCKPNAKLSHLGSTLITRLLESYYFRELGVKFFGYFVLF
jgi:hypothetical protein